MTITSSKKNWHAQICRQPAVYKRVPAVSFVGFLLLSLNPLIDPLAILGRA